MAPLLVDGAKVGYVFTFRDIGERKQTEAKLQHDAMHDVLTGLPNRALFLDRLNLALAPARCAVPTRVAACCYLDLDRFKEINDVLGHAAGDVVLIAVAERLRASLRPQDSAARLGGDEFAVLVENILTADDLEIVAKRILRRWSGPSTSSGTCAGRRQHRRGDGGPGSHFFRSADARRGLCHVSRQAVGRRTLRDLRQAP